MGYNCRKAMRGQCTITAFFLVFLVSLTREMQLHMEHHPYFFSRSLALLVAPAQLFLSPLYFTPFANIICPVEFSRISLCNSRIPPHFDSLESHWVESLVIIFHTRTCGEFSNFTKEKKINSLEENKFKHYYYFYIRYYFPIVH